MNAFTVLFIIAVIVIRIVMAAQGARKKQETAMQKSAPSALAERIRQQAQSAASDDEEEEYDGDDEEDEIPAPGHSLYNKSPQPVPEPRPAVSAFLADAALAAPLENLETGPETRAFSLDRSFSPESSSTKVSRSASAFPENLAYLPPLKRAIVMAEILGPPKANLSL